MTRKKGKNCKAISETFLYARTRGKLWKTGLTFRPFYAMGERGASLASRGDRVPNRGLVRRGNYLTRNILGVKGFRGNWETRNSCGEAILVQR